MTKSKIFAAVALTGFAITLTGLVAAPFNQSARAAGTESASQRIDAAFSLVQPDLAHPVPVRVSKGDLPFDPACAGQTWPNIAPDCLVTADGAPARQVRTVTVGHQTGEAETVLVRLPISEVAMR